MRCGRSLDCDPSRQLCYAPVVFRFQCHQVTPQNPPEKERRGVFNFLIHAMSWHSLRCAMGIANGAWIGLFSLAAAAQQANQPAQSAPPVQANPPSQSEPVVPANGSDQAGAAAKKVIHDQAEYSTFVAATNTQDPKERAEALESFAQHYPKSVVAADALEEAMDDWRAAGDSVKVLEVAKELLAADKGNVRALAIVVALDRVSASQGDSTALDELCLYATAGMREISMWQKPAGTADADFAKLRKQMEVIFNGAAGYCALEQKNYSQARDWLLRVYQFDGSNMQNVFQLAIADLEMTPIDADGFWYCAKAISLAKMTSNADAAGGMEGYCKAKYLTFHGNDQGWDSILAMGAMQSELPREFGKAVTPTSQPAAPAGPPHN